MQRHRHGTTSRLGRHKQITLALGLALGLTTFQIHAHASVESSARIQQDSPAATLMRRAAAAGIDVPADLPYFIERHSARIAKSGAASPKATHTVTSCADSGPGTLRAAVSFATSGDVIDLSGLNCHINLTSSIVTSVASLTIRRDPDTQPTKYGIRGNNAIRPLLHTGTGTLTLDGVMVANGRTSSSPGDAGIARGGCIYSAGAVTLKNQADVKYCTARNDSGAAEGGAIFAASRVNVENGGRVHNSQAIAGSGHARGGGIFSPTVVLRGGLVTKNTANAGESLIANGGGVHASKAVNTKYASIEDNKTIGGTALNNAGGGMWVGGDSSVIKYSTFSGNQADGGAALVFGHSSGSTGSLTLRSSTIANNLSRASSSKYGGAISLAGNATIQNSTISGNIEKNTQNEKYGAGISLESGVQLSMSSTILAGNTLDEDIPSDIGTIQNTGSATLTGTRNMIGWQNANITVPNGNLIIGVESPRLDPLADNGGLTKTMAPRGNSAAIDQGAANGFSVDQRGTGFPRVYGAQADIGALERSPAEANIFSNGFEPD